ncbi:MAG: tetratricopeptide repeat protein [Pleurocapsa sp.]
MKLTQDTASAKDNSAESHNDLGNLLAQQGKVAAAIASYRKAIALKPNLAIAHNNLGNLLVQQGETEVAIASYRTAIALEPNLAIAHNNLGSLFAQQGKMAAAIASYQTAIALKPNYHLAKFGITMAQLPPIYSTEAEIKSRRSSYQHYLANLAAGYQAASEQELAEAAVAAGSDQPFYLAYQGLNDRSLQQTYGAMICQLMASRYPQWCQPLPAPKLAANQKIRLGIVSGFFHHHSVWKIPLRGWVENIDRSEFELFGYYTGSIRDRETARAAKAFDRFEHHHFTVNQWAEKIAADNLQVLIFPEFGMNSMTVKLGCLRLAPVQITSWGHPETSGMPTIDYYLSSELMEPEAAEEHYTEKLIRLPNLGIYYQPIPIEPEAISKRDLGIQDYEIMFWCCQSLFKYLPQHDDVFPRIAQELGNAKFVFIKLESEFATSIFCQRLADTFKRFDLDYQDYCLFLPRLNAEAFIGVVAIADIFLDNIGWSGCNTTIESLTHNLPIVTLPGRLMRGRHTLAVLKMIGVEEAIAQSKDEYIQIAVRLGQDASYRRHIAQQIALNKHKLYGDLAPVRALEDFLFQVIDKPRRFDDTHVAQAFQRAEQYQRANLLSAAQKEYLQVIAAQPNHSEALYRLGLLAQKIDRPEEAEKYLSASVEVQPEFLPAWFSLGNLRQSQGQYQTAEEAYRQALKLRSDSAPIYNNLGYVLQQQGKWSAAASYYQQALKIEPECIEADVNWGNALYAQNKLSREKQIHYAQLNYKLGLSRHRVQDWQTAATYYHQAILMQPDLVDAHYHLGLALQQQRKLTEAIACYEHVLQSDSDCGSAYYNLGQIYQDLGDLNQATANFQAGLKLINSNYEAIESSVAQRFTIPEIPQGEMVIGDYTFPAIPPVLKDQANRPFWSVVIPVLNRPEYFPECLASVLAQWTTAEDMEIIVLDNGSQPPQWQIPEHLGKGIIRYYRFPETVSLQENWNTAVTLCQGQWIHLLHHDDYVLPEFYARLRASLENCPETVGAAFTDYENINQERQIIFTQKHNLENYRGIVTDWILRIGVSCTVSPPSVVIRRAAYEYLGGYKLDLPYTCDWEFYKRVASFYDWWHEPGILVHYREQANSITVAENINGSSGAAHRRAIDISASYLPCEHRAAITAKSRAFHFDWCLQRAQIPLKVGNLEGALCLIKEALKMDHSPETISRLSLWLQQQAATVVNKLASLNPASDQEATILLKLSRALLKDRDKTVNQETA